MNKSQQELLLLAQIRDEGLPEPERNYRFHETRRWLLDFAWPAEMVCIEVEGQVWGPLVRCHVCGSRVQKRAASGKWYSVREAGGRHTRGDGYGRDVEKYDEAVLAGWLLLRATPAMIQDGRALEWVKRGLEKNGEHQ